MNDQLAAAPLDAAPALNGHLQSGRGQSGSGLYALGVRWGAHPHSEPAGAGLRPPLNARPPGGSRRRYDGGKHGMWIGTAVERPGCHCKCRKHRLRCWGSWRFSVARVYLPWVERIP